MSISTATPALSPQDMQLLKARDAAKLLGISERKLWDLTTRGKLACIRFDRNVRWSVADLNNWIQEHRS